jgi:NAD+ diphosphatase
MTHPEPLPWNEAVLDRGSDRRLEPGFLDGILAGGGTRALVLLAGKTLVYDGGIAYLEPARLPPAELAVYLGSVRSGAPGGLAEGTDLVLLVLSEEAAEIASGLAPGGSRWAGFREAALELGAADSGIFIEANAIANWHGSHTHCPKCGSPTTIEVGGWVRRCPRDSSEHYPRTDPAIIVAVVGPDDRILLGGGSSWDSNRYSTLAGFVEPGESLEQAVVREIAEEVGVRIHSARYLGSQSWPFPSSLMLGFNASTKDTEARPDGVEVTRARWFSREEIQHAVSSGEVVISARTSIARALIEQWYGGRIEDAPAAAKQAQPAGQIAGHHR